MANACIEKKASLQQAEEQRAVQKAISIADGLGLSSEYAKAVMAYVCNEKKRIHSEVLAEAKYVKGDGNDSLAGVQFMHEESIIHGWHYENLVEDFQNMLSYVRKVQVGLVVLDEDELYFLSDEELDLINAVKAISK